MIDFFISKKHALCSFALVSLLNISCIGQRYKLLFTFLMLIHLASFQQLMHTISVYCTKFNYFIATLDYSIPCSSLFCNLTIVNCKICSRHPCAWCWLQLWRWQWHPSAWTETSCPRHQAELQQLGSKDLGWSSWRRRSHFLHHLAVLWQQLLPCFSTLNY